MVIGHRERARDVWNALAGMPPSALRGAFLLVLSQLGLQALRLWALVPRNGALTLASTARAFTLGEWVNTFAPARAGDALKVVQLCRAARGSRPISAPTATGAVLADKIVDGGSLVVLCAAAGVAGLGSMGGRVGLPGLGSALGAVAVSALLVLGVWLTRPGWGTRLAGWRAELMKGLSALTRPGKLVTSACSSVGAWMAEVFALRVLSGALGFPLPLSHIVLALAVLNLGISVPIAAANLGVYESVLAFGLSRSGVPFATALAIAAVHHALELLATNVGAAGLWLGGRGGGRHPSKARS
jgi:uncharacterized membrane protein YbhN (UPF0104 family)